MRLIVKNRNNTKYNSFNKFMWRNDLKRAGKYFIFKHSVLS
jgi:hypothetical protein